MAESSRKGVSVTLFTSDTNRIKSLRSSFIYIIISIVCALAGAIYEHFGHGVYSYYMIYAFLFPLAGGALPMTILLMFPHIQYPDTVSRYSLNSGIAVLTVGFLFKGVLEIYGTTNRLIIVYWIAAAAFFSTSIITYIVTIRKNHKENNKIE